MSTLLITGLPTALQPAYVFHQNLNVAQTPAKSTGRPSPTSFENPPGKKRRAGLRELLTSSGCGVGIVLPLAGNSFE
jgi:hypothetical protein